MKHEKIKNLIQQITETAVILDSLKETAVTLVREACRESENNAIIYRPARENETGVNIPEALKAEGYIVRYKDDDDLRRVRSGYIYGVEFNEEGGSVIVSVHDVEGADEPNPVDMELVFPGDVATVLRFVLTYARA